MTPNERNGAARGEGAERDPRLERVYRAGTQEGPPAHLDAAILAAAHREVGARPRSASTRMRAWHVPASIAAVVVLSVTLVMLVREEGGDKLESATAPTLRKDSIPVPAQPAAPDAAKKQERAQQPALREAAREQAGSGRSAARDDAAPVAQAKVAEEAKRRDAESAMRGAAELAAGASAKPEPQPPAPAAAPAPRAFPDSALLRDQRQAGSYSEPAPGGPRSSASTRGQSEADSSGPSAGPAGSGSAAERSSSRERAAGEGVGAMSMDRAPAAAPAAKPAPRMESRALKTEQAQRADSGRLAPLVKELDGQPADKWMEKIEALRRDGRKDEADELLSEFKRRFPDYPLPAALR